MSFAAEPYAQFVDDLLIALTGGVTREQFMFVPAQAPYRLAPPGPLVRSTLQVYGQVDQAFARFRLDRDFTLTADNVIQWKARADGTPAADARWPDEGTAFYANYDHKGPHGPAAVLSDRNPGSMTRLLAETFAREYAVLSKQLDSVYRAGFLTTATGRDLDQLVALLGLQRRTRTFAAGSAIFSRTSPAPADGFIPAGTKLSTAEPPAVVFETTTDKVLHRGGLSVEAPIRATVSGEAGVVAERTITVINRPILGVESVVNPQGTQLLGDDETDDALRARAQRALEGSGKATRGALTAALTSLAALRDKDLLLSEDHLARPGVVTVNIAAPLDNASAIDALLLLEETRPAGVRVISHLDVAPPIDAGALANVADDDTAAEEGLPATADLYQPVQIRALLLPATTNLTAAERAALKRRGEDACRAFVKEAGIGEVLVYNRLIAALMAEEGVLDVAVELYKKPAAGPATGPRRMNLAPGKTLRPKLDDLDLDVEVASELVAFDVSAQIVLTDIGHLVDTEAALSEARIQIAGQLQDRIGAVVGPINATVLASLIVPTESFGVPSLGYTVEYLEAGVRLNSDSPEVTLGALERPWIRVVKAREGSG